MRRFVPFILLICLFLTLRLFPISGHRFPFAYDNAKDSLAMMSMWEHQKPALLGPVSSLEGLYQGPLWYYVALPLNVLFSFSPIASVFTVITLGIVSLYLIYRYIGPWEALLYTISVGVIETHQTAWAPYIVSFPVLFLLLILWKQQKKWSLPLTLVVAGAIASIFHFEIAFGFVFVPLFFLCVYLQRTRLQIRHIFIAGVFAALFFLPHAAFELKHNFLQTRSVIRFVTHYQEEKAKVVGDSTPLQNIATLIHSEVGSVQSAVLPLRSPFLSWFTALLLGVCFISLSKQKKAPAQLRTVVLPLSIGLFLFYCILPFKPFYLVGILPLWIFAVGSILRKLPKPLQLLIAGVMICTSIGMSFAQYHQYLFVKQHSLVLLAPREQAVRLVYTLAAGAPFRSYQYVPEVYDFTYQLIYNIYARQHHVALPTEISYRPGVHDYNPWAHTPTTSTTDRVFLIVEQGDRPQFFTPWWNDMTSRFHVLSTHPITEKITVYEVTVNESSK